MTSSSYKAIPLTAIHKAWKEKKLQKLAIRESTASNFQSLNSKWNADDLDKLRQIFSKFRTLADVRAVLKALSATDSFSDVRIPSNLPEANITMHKKCQRWKGWILLDS